ECAQFSVWGESDRAEHNMHPTSKYLTSQLPSRASGQQIIRSFCLARRRRLAGNAPTGWHVGRVRDKSISARQILMLLCREFAPPVLQIIRALFSVWDSQLACYSIRAPIRCARVHSAEVRALR